MFIDTHWCSSFLSAVSNLANYFIWTFLMKDDIKDQRSSVFNPSWHAVLQDFLFSAPQFGLVGAFISNTLPGDDMDYSANQRESDKCFNFRLGV